MSLAAAPRLHLASPAKGSQSTASCRPLLQPRRRLVAPAACSSFDNPEFPHSYSASRGFSASTAVGNGDLLIVGPGVLGRLVAEIWRKENKGCKIFGQTMSRDHHEELSILGIIPSLRGSNIEEQVPYIIFCAPPSRSEDYAGDVRAAGLIWNRQGSFLFTSSIASYDCSDNSLCDEDTPSVPMGMSPRTDVLLQAENAALDMGGSVLRLAGLYKEDRGAHNFWLEKGSSDLRPDHKTNFIHYEDAASLAVAIMKKRLRGRIFLGCDNHPLSRKEVMDFVNRSGKYKKKFQGFTGTLGPLGKRMNNSKTREEIGWEPKYASFKEFLGLTD